MLTAISQIVLMCSTAPTASTLWVRAFVPLAIASLTLEDVDATCGAGTARNSLGR